MTGLNENLSPVEESERAELLKAYGDVLSTAAGRLVLFDILEHAAIYSSAYTGTDHATDYSLGRQSGGLYLIGKLNEVDPRLYPQLLMTVAQERAMKLAAMNAAQHGENEDDVEA